MTRTNATYVNTLCPDRISPSTGMLRMMGMSILGIPMLLTMDEEPLSPVKAYRIITAAPEVKVLMATPVSIMLVFIMIWKYPMKIPMTTPP